MVSVRVWLLSGAARSCALAVHAVARNFPPERNRRPVTTLTESDQDIVKTAIGKMRKRPEFLAANRGQRHAAPGFVILSYDRRDANEQVRLGTTVTKKVGNAVVRNRIKRRFRALAAELLPELGVAGHDYVLIGRKGGEDRDFSELRGDMRAGLKRLARKAKS